MKDLPRYGLLGAIFLVLFLLLLEWNKFSSSADAPTRTETLASTSAEHTPTQESADSDVDVMDATNNSSDDIPQTQDSIKQTTKQENKNGLVTIETDVLKAKIDLIGGDIVMVSLPTYWVALDKPDEAFDLLDRTSEKLYISQSGLIGTNGTDKPGYRPQYKNEKQHYVLAESEDRLVVDLHLPEADGVNITKRFIFKRGEYLVDVHYIVNNQSAQTWQAAFFGQIKRDSSVPKTTATGLQPFLGAAMTTPQENYKKMDFEEIEKSPFKETVSGGWIAMVQHYFISAWIASPDQENTFSTRKLKNESAYIMGYTGPTVVVAQGEQKEIGGQFYAGPKITQRLEEITPYLDLTVDYGWLWWVAKPIHWILQLIHLTIQNWGWSIVALTILIKIVLFPLSHKAYISMGHMRKVAPKLAALKEQCGDNRQKMQEEMMRLYRTEKINPLGGCLPMLLQMPVFIALYWVLMESVELRHAPFLGWIHDLSVMDPYFVLPILMGISMYYQQKMNPAPTDPMQAKVMQYLPIIFTFMFLWFPAGLVLYWLVNNITSMIHQGYINKLTESGKL